MLLCARDDQALNEIRVDLNGSFVAEDLLFLSVSAFLIRIGYFWIYLLLFFISVVVIIILAPSPMMMMMMMGSCEAA